MKYELSLPEFHLLLDLHIAIRLAELLIQGNNGVKIVEGIPRLDRNALFLRMQCEKTGYGKRGETQLVQAEGRTILA